MLNRTVLSLVHSHRHSTRLHAAHQNTIVTFADDWWTPAKDESTQTVRRQIEVFETPCDPPNQPFDEYHGNRYTRNVWRGLLAPGHSGHGLGGKV